MDVIIKTFKVVVHENLGSFIVNCKRREKILSAYASQKYTMIQQQQKKNNNTFYIAQIVKNIRSITEKSLMNHVILSFKAFLTPMTFLECVQKGLVIFFDYFNTRVEVECRRFIHSSNLILKTKLGTSCNDLSNLKFIERNVEILLNNNVINSYDNNNNQYRCVISHDRGFSIQIKSYYDQKETFLHEINSFELLHYSRESPIFDDEHYFLIHSKDKIILGVASFLDCNNLSVKTTYLNDNQGTILYQRIVIDDYKNPQPFILEHEFLNGENDVNVPSLTRYFDVSCRLSAKLPSHLIKNGYSNVSCKPIHESDDEEEDDSPPSQYYTFPKLDGVLATLKFYNHHFVVTNNLKSESFSHSLPKHLTHRLKDFSFIVESQLYESIFSTINKPKAMAIIDLHTTSFSAIERMNIIQKLKIIMDEPLSAYFIFFQGEKINNESYIFYPNKSLEKLNSRLKEYLIKNFIIFIKRSSENNDNNNHEKNIILKHGTIYEVVIDRMHNIQSVLKPRCDKIYPNSRKCIECIAKKL